MENTNQSNVHQDVSKNWVHSSRFIFYVSVFCFLAFVFGCSYRLYNQRWKGIGEPVVPESTKYNPSYTKPVAK
jgi:hypothetical protein